MFSAIRKVILKQYMIPYVGATKTMLSSVMFYISLINFLLISLVSFQTSIKPWAVVHASWLTLWSFFGILIGIVLVAIVIEYKFVIPSIYSFGSGQGYTHNNPLVKDIQEVLTILKEKDKSDKSI